MSFVRLCLVIESYHNNGEIDILVSRKRNLDFFRRFYIDFAVKLYQYKNFENSLFKLEFASLHYILDHECIFFFKALKSSTYECDDITG